MSLDVGLETRPKLKKQERREHILLELRLRPHVRISELAERFRVSTETVRRDLEKLSADGLLDRAHGGASALASGHYPGFDERASARVEERERIGRMAASLVQPGETLMVDSGSTTVQFARFLAYDGTPCIVITNSFPVAMALGQSDAASVIMCPGDYLPSESAVIGTDAVEFLERHSVDRCLIGATGISEGGPSETVRGFAAIKRAMLRRSTVSHLLVDCEKFGRKGLAQVGNLSDMTSVISDQEPEEELASWLRRADVEVLVAR
ncbi:DeoR/GlpR family DNA-binding transcription regulator [Litoreibacter janthinus]|uniref:Transcriptional regulator, DeoR family n=1 Tax=Litoreibacter janthinus TaxID=670154 RepID=A0A1I6ICC4_9RHOB|nr:DeoR/GlpR family DNA-binding transcription regulator [Litoreibacter janthinus]SFR64435.1 transcriptional regulator, DeoR family [Litoreibacter janthinus]